MRKTEVLEIEGREVTLSNIDKVMYPTSGFTKGQVIDYYIKASKFILPHLKDRPLTLKRYPDGVTGGFFYEKRCPPYRPAWVQTTPMWSKHHNADIHYCLANDVRAVVWASNLGNLEFHTVLAQAPE